MKNKFNIVNFLIVAFVVIVIFILFQLFSTAVKQLNTQKNQTTNEFAEYKPDSTFMPFTFEYNQYVAQFFQASKTCDESLKKVDVLLLNKNTNETYKFQIILDHHDYKYLYDNAVKFVERKVKNLPDKPLIKEPIKIINDTINNVFVTEYLYYRGTMILNPSNNDPNEVLIYIQDRKNCITVPLHTRVNERYTFDSLKVHSQDFMKKAVQEMFQ